jgi:hypothetical protein
VQHTPYAASGLRLGHAARARNGQARYGASMRNLNRKEKAACRGSCTEGGGCRQRLWGNGSPQRLDELERHEDQHEGLVDHLSGHLLEVKIWA